jgi:hypothetical protein
MPPAERSGVAKKSDQSLKLTQPLRSRPFKEVQRNEGEETNETTGSAVSFSTNPDDDSGTKARRPMRRQVTATMAALVAFCGVLAAQDDISGVQLDFHETRTRAGEVIREMSGSFFLGADDSWRLDRVFRGERLTVMTSGGEQVEINHDLGVAVRGPAGSRLTVPTLQGYGATVIDQSVPVVPPPMRPNLQRDVTVPTSYGQRAVGPLLLDGDGWALDGHVIERWMYALPGGTTVTLEYRAEHTDENGVRTVDERHVTSWERVTVSRDRFAMPDGLRVFSRWER